ncbi:glycosyltransferase family protein [Flavobacterium hiemivividum]|uniref:Glycosyltransferase family 1 protein n=1 Tax=Flavobacterium hiemivividum TaxID=2541734 RepID=A0A4R5D2S7_9FLAO|nr:glycosyltransferase [Flavobacterium hiemivividum]TDE04585.1 glycosyltransferase family 1 protein [Flavobacterium hiemivividum]
MKFLIIAQDLRVSGTSEGVVSRSFIGQLRKVFPNAVIDVVYLRHEQYQDQLDLLPVNDLKSHFINRKIPFYIKWLNWMYWRIFHVSLNEWYIQKKYTSIIRKIDYQKYDTVFIRSCGLDYEAILGAIDLPILQKTILNFHDPYPVFWCSGSQNKLTNLELFRLKKMARVVSQAKACISPATILSADFELIYGHRNKFYVLPHQFCPLVFDFSDFAKVRTKGKKVTLSYHGIIQFGRNIEILLDAYKEIIESNATYKQHTEFVLRLKGNQAEKLKEKYGDCTNIIFLGHSNFSNASNEQSKETDIIIILENGPLRSNILVGKVPFVASLQKPILCLSPKISELRSLIQDEKYIADCDNLNQIKSKLEYLISERLESNEAVQPFGDYFSDENFKVNVLNILNKVNLD